MFGYVVCASLLVSVSAFLQPRFGRSTLSTAVIVRQDLSLAAIKPDLFSGIDIKLSIFSLLRHTAEKTRLKRDV